MGSPCSQPLAPTLLKAISSLNHMPQLATDDKRLRKPDKNTAFSQQTDSEGLGQWKLQENREHDLAPVSVSREGPWRQSDLRAVKLHMLGMRVEREAWGGGREGSLGASVSLQPQRLSVFTELGSPPTRIL